MIDLVTMPVQKVDGQELLAEEDVLAVEEPLEIRLGFQRQGQRIYQALSVTMRTPGHDRELAAGFLVSEGIVSSRDQIQQIHACPARAAAGNVIRVDLKPEVDVNLPRLERHSYTNSSCGVCGKTSLEALQVCRRVFLRADEPVLDPNLIHGLPATLRAAQAVFDRTGGLHAAGLFDEHGKLLCLREDVGRHNSVDKLIGGQFQAGNLPLSNHIVLLSGRACFELVQKAMMAGIPVLAAVGAPSSLAVELARECGMTLLGFVRNGRFNIYAGDQRIRERTTECTAQLQEHACDV
jgi:FdhD protein